MTDLPQSTQGDGPTVQLIWMAGHLVARIRSILVEVRASKEESPITPEP